MKIAIVVQGRFHAFDLARALISRGHDVRVFTNYPKWAVKKFQIPPNRVSSFWLHGVVSDLVYRFHLCALRFEPERWLDPVFGRWAAAQIAKEPWDIVHTWSGVAEEILTQVNNQPTLNLIMRGSAHIRTQGQILEQEEKRIGRRVDRPGPWITAREQEEYSQADRIVVLSSFAYHSFLAEGFEPKKLTLLPLGTSTAMFRPNLEVVEARCRRIVSGEPLRVLFVGALSMRKGLWDMAEIFRTLAGRNFHCCCVGPATPEGKVVRAEMSRTVEFVPKQRQSDLPKWYAWGDVFVFPTVEDGFAVVLAQAQANALPILTTTNCCGPDLIREGETGWVLPIRSPEAFVERLLWCDSHRKELAQMVLHSYQEFRPRDWDDVAADFEAFCTREVISMRSQPVTQNGN